MSILLRADRDGHEDQSISERYIPRETIGYQQLDNYGDWRRRRHLSHSLCLLRLSLSPCSRKRRAPRWY